MTAPMETDEMTAPAETTADDLMVQEDDRAAPEESDFDLTGIASDGAASDGAASDETAEDQQMVPEDDRDMPRGSDLDPAGVITVSDPESPDPAAPEYEGAADADGALAEPGVADVSDAGMSDAGMSDADVSDAGTPSAAWSPSAVVTTPDAEPEPTPASSVADDSTSADERWHEILTMFVDDPRSSVELAAGLVDESAEALVMFVQERQQALLSDWQGDEAGTEEMRVALQQYRTFFNRIEDLSRQA
jgi:hypothetical protein